MEFLQALWERLDLQKLTRRQKIYCILGITGTLLMLLGLLAALAAGFTRGAAEQSTPEATPSPETDTPAPPAYTVTVAGKQVDPDTDCFDLSGRKLTEEEMEEIVSLQNLTTLSLTDCGIADVGFLARLPGLRTLYLPSNRVNDLTPLAGLKQLKTLYLDNNPLTDLTPLAELTSLTTLSLQGVEVADYVLEDLREAIPNCRIFCDSVVEEARPLSLGGLAFTEDVEVLDLSGREITDISKLARCLQLRELDLSSNPIQSLNTLSGLPKLQVLHLMDAGLTDEHLEFLRALTRLTYLDIRENDNLTAEGLEALEKALPDCQIFHDTVYYTLSIGGKAITSDQGEVDLTGLGITNIRGMEKFTMLRRLVLYDNNIQDLSPLEGLTSLEELEAGYNNIADLSPLSGHTALRRLDVSNNTITDLTPLAGCDGLVDLDLHNNDIDSLEPLYGCAALCRVDLTGNNALQADQIRRLQAALPSCLIVTDVDLSMPEPTPEASADTTVGGTIAPAPTVIPGWFGTPVPSNPPLATAIPTAIPTAAPPPTATPPATIPEYPESERIPVGGPE